MELFPVPSTPTHYTEFRRLPGATSESTKVLRKLLLENHEKWHIMFNDEGFHNHISHHLLALWSLGASAESLQKAYDAEIDEQRPIKISEDVVPITEDNFCDHLGEQRFYQPYLTFFESQITSLGPVETLVKFVFSPQFNSGNGKMLNRYHAGVLHPFIHVGYGLEFKLPGMVSEGLAMACVTQADPTDLLTSLTESSLGTASSFLTQALSSLSLLSTQQVPLTVPPSPHALDFLTKIDEDPSYDMERTPLMSREFFEKYENKIGGFVKEWFAPGSSEGGTLLKIIEKKAEELVWMNTVIYAAGYTNSAPTLDKFKADFFTMHLVTSSLFLSSHIQSMQSHHPHAVVALLQAYFATALSLYIVRRGGRPINLIHFYRNTEYVVRPGYNLRPEANVRSEANNTGSDNAKGTNNTGPDSDAKNVWTSIIESSLTKEDEHYPKLQRALMHYSVLYGLKTSGDIFGSLPDVEEGSNRQEGSESANGFGMLDGSTFWRAAALTQERVASVTGGDTNDYWDFGG